MRGIFRGLPPHEFPEITSSSFRKLLRFVLGSLDMFRRFLMEFSLKL